MKQGKFARPRIVPTKRLMRKKRTRARLAEQQAAKLNKTKSRRQKRVS